EPLPPIPQTKTGKEFRSCPRCKKRLSDAVTLCQHCQLYVGDSGVSKADSEQVANQRPNVNQL
ncbi:MAG: hypothetical protein AAF483_27060, partial [Planctomycetota bacterium]